LASRDALLQLLYFYSANYISADSLAFRLGISRNTVLRYIRQLRKEGFPIHGCTNRGYALVNPEDIISPSELAKYYPIETEKVRVFSSIPSTNTMAKEMAECGAPEGTVIIAEKQTHGRGRHNRLFHSPDKSGLYMSIVLRPSLAPSDTLLITTLAAVAVSEAIELLTHRATQIKWVNDVFLDGKKVSGILTEASFQADTGRIDYVVLGIGVNVYMPENGFPAEINNIAGSLFHTAIPHGRCRLAAYILERFYHYFQSIEKKEFLEPYRQKNFLLERKIDVIGGNSIYPATVLGINDDFTLKISLSDGQTKNLSSGEVSVRLDK